MIVLSPLARGGGSAGTNRSPHASTLRPLQDIFGVRPLLSEAAAATSLDDLFDPAAASVNGIVLTSPTLPANGQFRFTLVGLTPGTTNFVEASSNLSNWFRLATYSSPTRSEEHTSELQSQSNLVCRLLLEKKKK